MERVTWGLLLNFFVSFWLVAAEKDIFKDVEKTRRKASAVEYSRAIGLDGCAGTLIAPNIGLSAAHCRPDDGGPLTVASGVAMFRFQKDDGEVGKTLEIGSSRTFDYWIFEIKWKDGKLPAGMKVAPLIQTSATDLQIASDKDLDKIYTLGFPGDVSEGRDLYYAEGYGKLEYKDQLLLNNISLINGNSGGLIARSDNHMLVSIVSGGPHRLGEEGFNENDPTDPKHWNWGPSLRILYKESLVLRELFPEGHNKFDGDLGHFNQFDLSKELERLFNLL